jgi:hypothetical protein
MYRFIALFFALTLFACSKDTPDTAKVAARPLASGVELSGMDKSIRPQDDFYAYANGGWLATTEIPADQYGWGSYMTLRDDSLTKLRTIVEEVAADTSDNRTIAKIGDYYNAWLDESRIEALGMGPLEKSFLEIDALESHADIARWLGEMNEVGVDGPFNLYVNQDDKDSTKYVLFIVQSGLGLPDRDYYFDSSERGIELIDGYTEVVEKLLAMSGYEDAAGAAARMLVLEMKLAENQWDKVKSRDADAVYNKTTDVELGELLSNFNLDAYFAGIGTGRQEYVIVSQPSYLEAANRIFVETDLDTWKEYLRLNTIFAFASFLNSDVVDAQFEFFNKTLYGREEQPPRWQRAILSMNGNIGELLGQLYVEKYFPPEAKERMVKMVDNLMAAYADSIENLEWMSEETKVKALEKLAKFTPKIGYPFILTVLVAPPLISRDLANNALPLYLCRPLSRSEYVLGKMAVVVFLLSLVTWVPGLVIFFFQASLAGFAWLWANLWMTASIFFGSMAWIVLLSLIALAISALVRWRVVASAAILGLFFVPSAFGEIVNSLFLTRAGSLISLWATMDSAWRGLFGLFERRAGTVRGKVSNPIYEEQFFDIVLLEPPLWASWLVIVLVCAICVWLLARKVRAYEVIK